MHILGACTMMAVLNIAMVSDILTGKIKNSLIAAGLLLGAVYQLWARGMGGILFFFAGALLPLALTFPLFAFRAIGAGDIKLLAAVGGFLGAEAMPRCLLLCLGLGAAASLIKILYQKSYARRWGYFAGYVKTIWETGKITPYGQSFEEEEAVVHLSAAILFAALFCAAGGFG